MLWASSSPFALYGVRRLRRPAPKVALGVSVKNTTVRSRHTWLVTFIFEVWRSIHMQRPFGTPSGLIPSPLLGAFDPTPVPSFYHSGDQSTPGCNCFHRAPSRRLHYIFETSHCYFLRFIVGHHLGWA